MSTAGDGTWKTVEAADARAAAELVCGEGLRSFGIDSEICARVRALGNGDTPAVFFYAEKSTAKRQKTELVPEPA
jgi:hypothetical protein